MASYDYNGKTYFYTFGKWVDSDSRPVKPETAAELSSLFSEDEIKPKEKAALSRRTGSKKQTKKSGNIYVISHNTKVYPSKNSRQRHKKATEKPYYRKFELTEDQKRALSLLESGKNVFLTGEAGTGKSFVLNEFLYRNRQRNIIVCAPTGIAAINVGGSTLHRIFRAPIGVAKPGSYNTNPSMAVIKADIVVIDEISMCRFDLFEYVIRTIKKAEEIRQNMENADAINNGRLPHLIDPKQIIVVGDFFQLAPVISSKDREALFTYWDRETVGDGFAFISPLWDELEFKSIVIKEIVRQTGDNDYIENLNKIRIGDKSGIDWFNNNISMEPIPNGIYLCGTNQKADNINERESDALPGKAVDYMAQITGAVENGDKMTKDKLTLKVGMQVMTLINDTNEGFQNGSIGKIAALETDHVDVKLSNGRLVTVKPFNWEILGYEVQDDKVEKIVLGNFMQIPLKIAYAITIHKSQGQTYSNVNISPDCFAAGQLYVALSRARTASGMSFEHVIERRSLRTSIEVKRFYDELIDSSDTFELKDSEEIDNEFDLETANEDKEESLSCNDESVSSDSDFSIRRSPLYEKVMEMSDREADSCYMYRSIREHHSAYASWTQEEDEQLLKELSQGLSNQEIAQIHERTVGAIRSRIAKLNEFC